MLSKLFNALNDNPLVNKLGATALTAGPALQDAAVATAVCYAPLVMRLIS